MTLPYRLEEPSARPRNVAILVFDGVEVLDFAGPFEVFSVAGRRDGLDPFNVYTVAETGRPISASSASQTSPMPPRAWNCRVT